MKVKVLGKRRMDFEFDEVDEKTGKKKELHSVCLYCEVLGEIVDGLEGNKVVKVNVHDTDVAASMVKDVKVGGEYAIFFEEGGRKVGYIGAPLKA